MDIEDLTETIDRMVAAVENPDMQDDPESWHSWEDDIMKSWISSMATPESLAQFKRMWNLDFPRWCA